MKVKEEGLPQPLMKLCGEKEKQKADIELLFRKERNIYKLKIWWAKAMGQDQENLLIFLMKE